jgi:hypothetical protein
MINAYACERFSWPEVRAGSFPTTIGTLMVSQQNLEFQAAAGLP